MVDLAILGTIALDDIETPFGKRISTLGGSATYAAYAASFFAKPGIISIIGNDFPPEHIEILEKKGIDLNGVKVEGKTFRWSGFYEFDMNEAKTIKTELNSLETFSPKIPEEYKDVKYLFLANIDPKSQLKVLNEFKDPFVVLDTMNLWINYTKEDLIKVIKKAQILLLNDGEARQLFETVNLVQAANKALKLGPKAVIIKKGEHGSLLFMDSKHFNAPGYPLENVVDPTGCGDVFGGSLIGYLAKTKDHSEKNIRKAMIYGSALASFNAEGFSIENMKGLTLEKIEGRIKVFKDIREF